MSDWWTCLFLPDNSSTNLLGLDVGTRLSALNDVMSNSTLTDIKLVGYSEGAARRLGLDPSQVRRLLKDGIIEGKKLGHYWVVLSLNYQKKKFGVGRKKKKGEQLDATNG